MVIHSTVLCYIHPGLFDAHWPIQVHSLQSSMDYLHPSLQPIIHSESLSANHYNYKNSVRRAKNNNTLKINKLIASIGNDFFQKTLTITICLWGAKLFGSPEYGNPSGVNTKTKNETNNTTVNVLNTVYTFWSNNIKGFWKKQKNTIQFWLIQHCYM